MGYTKIICGKLYDGIHDELQENKEILIKDKYNGLLSDQVHP